MKSSQKGFAVLEGLLILVIVGLIAGVGWYVYDAKNKADKSLNNANSSSNTGVKISAKKRVSGSTEDWTPYSSAKGQFSLRYPSTWVQPTKACNSELSDRTLYLGPDKDSVLKCATEFFGQMFITSIEGDKRNTKYDDNVGGSYTAGLGSGYNDVVKKDVIASGVAGQRFSGTAPEDPQGLGGLPKGSKVVVYVFYANGNTYVAYYEQTPPGHVPSKNVLSDFDLMVTKTLKFST
jgi:hypothetical protein